MLLVLLEVQGDTTVGFIYSDESIVELYQINKTPLTEINKIHTDSMINIGMNSYTVSVTNGFQL